MGLSEPEDTVNPERVGPADVPDSVAVVLTADDPDVWYGIDKAPEKSPEADGANAMVKAQLAPASRVSAQVPPW